MQNYQLKNYKFSLILLTIAISVMGIIVIGSADDSVQKTQIFGLCLGLGVMIVISLIDYLWVLKFSWLIYAVVIALLAATLLFGDSSGGAQRWIELPFLRFQPSELCKILLILFFAQFFSQYKEDISKPKTIVIALALAAVPLFLILKQPDLSTTIVVASVFALMFFMAGIHRKIVLLVLGIGIPLAVLALVIAIQPNQPFLEQYQQNRILAWLYPEDYETDEAMQQQNSMMAIGSGQLRGKGLNNEEVASLKNGNFVPEPQTDFIFAVVGEELGFVGCCIIIILLLLIVLTCISIGRKAQDGAGMLICYGMAALIGFQSTINMCVTTGLFPNTGVTLPFVSYGLTSLVSLYIGIGFVLNVGLQPRKYDRWRIHRENWTYRA